MDMVGRVSSDNHGSPLHQFNSQWQANKVQRASGHLQHKVQWTKITVAPAMQARLRWTRTSDALLQGTSTLPTRIRTLDVLQAVGAQVSLPREEPGVVSMGTATCAHSNTLVRIVGVMGELRRKGGPLTSTILTIVVGVVAMEKKASTETIMMISTVTNIMLNMAISTETLTLAKIPRQEVVVMLTNDSHEVMVPPKVVVVIVVTSISLTCRDSLATKVGQVPLSTTTTILRTAANDLGRRVRGQRVMEVEAVTPA